MKSKSIFLIILGVITVVALISYSLSMPKGDKMMDLSVVLSFDKTKYRSDEPIRASIILKNVGNKSVVIRKRMLPSWPGDPKELREVVFVINGPLGDILPVFRIQSGPLTLEDFVTLSPGETFENTINIQRLYHLKTIGTYSVSVIYQNAMDPSSLLFGKKAWKGEINSNVAIFEIIP